MAASVMQAHRGGLVQASGSGATMVTASRYGTVILWPEAELRSIAEGAGFVLPSRAPPGIASSGSTRQTTISQVRATFKTGHSVILPGVHFLKAPTPKSPPTVSV